MEGENRQWWENSTNKTTFDFPLSIVKDGDYWIVTGNKDTEKLVGEFLIQCTSSKVSKEEAVAEFFRMFKLTEEFWRENSDNYERFVPFIKGDWNIKGGKWFTIFGFHFYFRHGKNMKGGFYFPFTNLNLTVSNYWRRYRKNHKKKKNEK